MRILLCQAEMHRLETLAGHAYRHTSDPPPLRRVLQCAYGAGELEYEFRRLRVSRFASGSVEIGWIRRSRGNAALAGAIAAFGGLNTAVARGRFKAGDVIVNQGNGANCLYHVLQASPLWPTHSIIPTALLACFAALTCIPTSVLTRCMVVPGHRSSVRQRQRSCYAAQGTAATACVCTACVGCYSMRAFSPRVIQHSALLCATRCCCYVLRYLLRYVLRAEVVCATRRGR